MEELCPAVTLPLRMGVNPCDHAIEIKQMKLITDTGRLLPASYISLTTEAEIIKTEEIDVFVSVEKLPPDSNTRLARDSEITRTEEVDIYVSDERLPPDSNKSLTVEDGIRRTEEMNISTSDERLLPDSNTTLMGETEIIRTDEIDLNASGENTTLAGEVEIIKTEEIDFSAGGSSQFHEHEIMKTEEIVYSPLLVSDSSCILPEELSNDLESLSTICSSTEHNKIKAITKDSSLEEEGKLDKLLLSRLPLWGYASVCGRREEMEDAFSVIPFFSQINGENTELGSCPAHFFGVFDGHGGAQVAKYCRHRMHAVLQEEITNLGENKGNCCWENALTSSFLRIDDEVSGIMKGHSGCLEPISPDTVGSTSIVAVISSSEIIVANCGDSRAVLCRGKEAFALSNDHKPEREDERARIEAAGGKVINWRGYRVSGFLAMSRSIGDRHLKDLGVIANPEITRIRRAKDHDCLILATDGLWDVMTNEEACAAARRRIVAWHRKYGVGATSAPARRGNDVGEGVDPAAHAAAEYLSRLSHQRGSADNITVIVIDLRAHRKVKAKAVNARK